METGRKDGDMKRADLATTWAAEVPKGYLSRGVWGGCSLWEACGLNTKLGSPAQSTSVGKKSPYNIWLWVRQKASRNPGISSQGLCTQFHSHTLTLGDRRVAQKFLESYRERLSCVALERAGETATNVSVLSPSPVPPTNDIARSTTPPKRH